MTCVVCVKLVIVLYSCQVCFVDPNFADGERTEDEEDWGGLRSLTTRENAQLRKEEHHEVKAINYRPRNVRRHEHFKVWFFGYNKPYFVSIHNMYGVDKAFRDMVTALTQQHKHMLTRTHNLIALHSSVLIPSGKTTP